MNDGAIISQQCDTLAEDADGITSIIKGTNLELFNQTSIHTAEYSGETKII